MTTALDATDRADVAESKARRADYLAAFDHRLSASLNERRTERTIAQVALPERDAWALVDLLAPNGEPVRLAIVHPDPNKKQIAERLTAHWVPRDDDPLGFAAARRAGKPVCITHDVDKALGAAAHTAEDLALLQELGFGACLVVPIRTGEEVDGAITFVSALARARFAAEEVALAVRIAEASAHALRNARLYSAVDRRRSVAEKSNASRSDALANVTHELRTPLSAIGGYAELLQLGLRGPVNAEQVKDLERIRWNQQHLLELIADILNFVRIDRRRIEFDIGDVPLAAATREVAEMLEPVFRAKQQGFVFEECDATLLARADADRVRQIVINLITNATKYSPPETQLTIRCGADQAGVFVEFTDQGPGIPEEQLEPIFEPFVQLEGGAASRGGGVGLGLAIARQLARGMSGDLTVRSVIGAGSTFRLILPGSDQSRRSTDASSV